MGRSERVEAARAYAVAAHGAQRYGDGPYVVHLDEVAALVEPYGEAALVAAYLHDVVEDTGTGLEAVRARFGEEAARAVGLLTDCPGATRAERKAATHKKLAAAGDADRTALIVKAADRLANLRRCGQDRDRRRAATYLGEHPEFSASARRTGLCDDLWSRIEAAIEALRAILAEPPGR